MSTPRAIQIHRYDNVATLIDDLDAAGPVQIIGSSEGKVVAGREPIKAGHKLALVSIEDGAAVNKFGVPIGHATEPIAAGAWVHLHNLASEHDARSGTLDKDTGATTDTIYH